MKCDACLRDGAGSSAVSEATRFYRFQSGEVFGRCWRHLPPDWMTRRDANLFGEGDVDGVLILPVEELSEAEAAAWEVHSS